jgi:hypothetical protein
MKNIHVLPTDKPSLYRFVNGILKKYNNVSVVSLNSVHIYITSDEKIKEGEKCITFGSDKCKGQLDTFQSNVRYSRKPHKIILTTDPDLIADGVQPIDDEFLEWFVKNPSCEYVDVIDDTFTVGEMSKLPLGTRNHKYKIIIIQEEPKKETLDEAFEKWADQQSEKGIGYDKLDVLRFGAKWQQDKKMYSEEDLREAFRQGIDNVEYCQTLGFYSKLTEQDWFEQFKNK